MSNNKYFSLIFNTFFIVIILCVDHFTYLSLYPFYLVPIFNLVRIRLFYLLPAALLFSALSILAENGAHVNIYNNYYVQVFFYRSLVLFILSYLAISYSISLDKARKRFDQMKNLLPICPVCGSIHCPDGKWRDLDSLLDNPAYFITPPHLNCNSMNSLSDDIIVKQ